MLITLLASFRKCPKSQSHSPGFICLALSWKFILHGTGGMLGLALLSCVAEC